MAKRRNAKSLQGLDRTVLVALVLVGLVQAVGDRVPLPGLAPDVLAAAGDATRNIKAWSVLALGLDPVLSVLLLFEALKLLVPGFARWTAQADDGPLHPRTAFAALALLLAAYQANDFYRAFAEIDAIDQGALSACLLFATLVGGVATLLLLAERVSVPGLAIGGVWLVLSIPWMEAVVFAVIDLHEQVAAGSLAGPELAIPAGFAAAVAAVVFSSAVLRGSVKAAGGDPVEWSQLLVWPPLIAQSLADFAADRASALWPAGVFQAAIVWVLCFGVVLPIVLFLYVETIERLSARATLWRRRHAVLALVAGVQIATCVGFQLLSVVYPDVYPIQGPMLIVIAVVLSSAYRPTRATLAGKEGRAGAR